MFAAPRIAAAVLAAGTGHPQRLRELAMRVCASPCERVAVAVVLRAGTGAMTPVLHGLVDPLRGRLGAALRLRSLMLLAYDHHHVTATHLERLLAASSQSTTLQLHCGGGAITAS